jgi:hypothetical protein
MRRFQSILCASLLTLAVSTAAFASTGNISGLSTGNISGLSAGNISGLSNGNISGLSNGNISGLKGRNTLADYIFMFLMTVNF